MAKPRALILRAPGANCDQETQFAFEQAGALADRIHIRQLREQPKLLLQYQILAIPGGFTYGDDVAAGKILASQLSHFLGDMLRQFRARERMILGICNGFQALLKAGLLLQPDEDGPLATLAHNENGKFEDRWVHVEAVSNRSLFLKGYTRFEVPVAHGEGRFIVREPWLLSGLEQSGQVVLRYVVGDAASVAASPTQAASATVGYPANPNGSQGDVAGICDASGRVLGLMPHPERHVLPTQHPQWTRRGLAPEGDGLRLFRNAVECFQ
jgi:phosphoribosylformylglycinamidine synthase